MESVLKGFILSGALNDADTVAYAVSSACNANVTSFRRQGVIEAFKTHLPVDAILQLRGAPFVSRDLIVDGLFRVVFSVTREAGHDDILLGLIRQQYRRAPYSPAYRGGAGGEGGNRGKGRGQFAPG